MQASERAVWKEDFEFILLDSLPVASRVFGSCVEPPKGGIAEKTSGSWLQFAH